MKLWSTCNTRTTSKTAEESSVRKPLVSIPSGSDGRLSLRCKKSGLDEWGFDCTLVLTRAGCSIFKRSPCTVVLFSKATYFVRITQTWIFHSLTVVGLARKLEKEKFGLQATFNWRT